MTTNGKFEIPEFLFEMSKQMKEQDNRLLKMCHEVAAITEKPE